MWRRLTRSRWDSSDPDRAPPPLPLNPQSPSFSSRNGTSSAIQSAHAALVPVLTKRMSEGSPDKAALVKGGGASHQHPQHQLHQQRSHNHLRMQSLQSGSVRDLSLLLEGPRHPPLTPGRPFESTRHDRPSTPTQSFSRENTSEPRSPDHTAGLPTPIVRPTVRRPATQSILGENTPPQSSTMLALQAMGGTRPSSREGDGALSNITNGATPTKGSQTLDSLSSQILSLTNIAQNLQKELGQLSRRSKDNATDLLSLKKATSTRDEDIRRSLRDLMGNMSEASSRIASREHYGGLFLDNKPHCSSPPNGRPFQLPRIPSPKSFADSIDGASIITPSLSGVDGPASVALLDKILRALGTKDGQESLASLLSDLTQKLSGVATAAKIDELAQLVREQAECAIVPEISAHASPLGSQAARGSELELCSPEGRRIKRLLFNGESRRSSAPPGRGAELLNEDLINIIRSVKDSVAQGGGLTAEVKALVCELRGEVLGMGRELGKRLEKMGSKAVEESEPPSKDEVSRVIDEGLEQIKEQLNRVLREHWRQSQASASSQKTLVDYQEIYNAMRAALRDTEASRGDMPYLSREDVIEAVRDAWENYKPEIEVQQLGLEREEVLTCLKEGLQEYMPRGEKPTGATREEVFKAVVEGLKHFVPPQMHTSATLSRDEIIEAVRDCLEEFEFPVSTSALGNDMTHRDMVHAVKEGLEGLDLPRVDALVAHANNDEVLARLRDIMEYMEREFNAISEEAKQNMAANGRDTEQVLDATKDGLENLRTAIESYIDRATGVAGQENFLEKLSQNMAEFKEELSKAMSEANEDSRGQLKSELESLREVVNSSMVPATPQPSGGSQEVLEALHGGLNSLRQEILRPRPETSEILDALQDGLDELRVGIDRVTHKPVDLTANDEIIDALRSGLDSVRSDIEALRDSSHDKAIIASDPPANDEVLLDVLKTSLNAIRSEIEALRDSVHQNAVAANQVKANDDILDTLRSGLDSLRLEIEGLRENGDEETIAASDMCTNSEILDMLKSGIDSLKLDIEVLRKSNDEKAIATSDVTTSDEIHDTLKSGLDSLKLEIEALRESNDERAIAANERMASDDILNVLRSGLDSLRLDIEALRENQDQKTIAASDVLASDQILDILKSGLGSLKQDIEALRDSTHDKAIAAVDSGNTSEILDAVKSGLDSVRSEIEALRDSAHDKAVAAVTAASGPEQAIFPADIVTSDDIKNLELLITQLRNKIEDKGPQSPSENVHQEDMARLEDMLRSVHDCVSEIATKEPAAPAEEGTTDSRPANEEVATREDVEAIETILRNTKARLDDLIDGEQAVRKEHLDGVESAALETREALGSLSDRLGSMCRKEDLAELEAVLGQLSLGLSELKDQLDKDTDDDNATKTDIEAVETVVLEMKTALDGLCSTDFASLSSKEDVAGVEAAIKQAAEKLDTHVEVTSKAHDDRQAEIVGVADRVGEVKTLLKFQETIQGKLEEGWTGIEALNKLLENMGDTVKKNENVSVDLKDMFDCMKTCFEESKEVVVGARLESNEKLLEATETMEAKLDEKVAELMTKYDEFKATMEEKSAAGEARDSETEAAVVGTKAVAEEVKLLIDTLGSTVTDSLEKMEEASKTVFSKVEDLAARTEERQVDDKAEHQQTRDQVQQAASTVEEMHGEVKEYQPKILEAVRDLMLLVGEHFEHSKSSTTELQDKMVEARAAEQAALLPPEKYDDSEVREKLERLMELKYDDSEVRERLKQLLENKYDDSGVQERLDQLVEQKYDDASVQEKLDRLVEHGNSAGQALARLETLDQVHQLVASTAAELAQFLSSQRQRIADEHEDREKTLQETTVAVERKQTEQEHLTVTVLSLRDEEERLRRSIASLRAEQESLIRQRTRLTGDVSSLETAMQLRKEALLEMEHRAERLERRIMEGVMDHSRVLLMANSSKRGDKMSRKRVKKPPTEQNEAAAFKAQPAVSIALSAKRNLASASQNGAGRRIASLSQMNSDGGPILVKRSQSVRTPTGCNALRKRSWGGGAAKGLDAEDKENAGIRETVEEVEEPDSDIADGLRNDEAVRSADTTTVLDSTVLDGSDDDDNGSGGGSCDGQSETGTLRRSSLDTTVMSSSTGQYTESEAAYSEYTESAASVTTTTAGSDNGLVVYGQQ